jgi:hypothetical protein
MAAPAPLAGYGSGVRGRGRGSWDVLAVAAFAAFLLWALVPIAYLLGQAATSPRAFGGAQSIFPGDQYQYMSWIRGAGEHVLAGNGYDPTVGDRVFLHPMFGLSGAAWRAGLSLQLAFLLWVPVAVAVLALGFTAYVRRLLDDPRGRVAALAIALFFVTPAHAVIGWGDVSGAEGMGLLAGELSPALLSWGYLPTIVSLGLMPLFLLGVERVVDPARRGAGRSAGRYAAGCAALGALASWLHPWQGATLLVVLAGAVVWGRDWRALPRLALPAAATLAPLVYYALLAEWDSAWAIGRTQTDVDRPSLLLIAIALAPLAAFALAAWRPRAAGLQERAVRVWPVAALAVYLGTAGHGYGLHALEGMSLPLGILAVEGWRRLRLPAAVGVAGVLAVTLPGLVYTADFFRDVARADDRTMLLRDDEARALRFLEDAPDRGGVLASPRIAAAVPPFTGLRVWSGHPTWTPDFPARAARSADLFAGRLRPGEIRALLREARVRYLLADCAGHPDLTAALRPQLAGVRRFGCATVYVLRGPAPPAEL